jgi:general secretion pathway protein M
MNLKKLSKREKLILAAAACAIGLFGLVQLVVVPVFDKRDRMRSTLQAKTVVLQEMRQLQSEYNSVTQRSAQAKARFDRRSSGFTLFSFLDKLAGEAGVKDRITYMKPSKTVQKNNSYKLSRVEMKLEGITLEQLTTYLYGVETSENMVSVSKISVSKKDNKQGLLNAVLLVETVET